MSNITSILLKYVIGLVGITIVVIVHEIGHLVAARCNHIEVEVFSFGIGPSIWKKEYKGCEYRLSLLPFGGYCRLKGSDDLSQALLHDQNKFMHTEDGSLFSASPLGRILTYLAGPAFNIIFAIIIYALLSLVPIQRISIEPRIATVNDYPSLFDGNTSPSFDQGLRTGDLVLSLDNHKVEDWEELQKLLDGADGSALFEVQRNEQELLFVVHAEKREDGSYFWGLSLIQDLVVDNVRPHSPEYRAGLQTGDRILEAQSRQVENQLDLMSVLNGQKEMLSFLVLSGQEEKIISFMPNLTERKEIDLNFSLKVQTKPADRGQIGIAEGFLKTKELFVQTFGELQRLVTREEHDIRSSVTGMARSALMIGDITTLGLEHAIPSGLYALLYLMGVVSISLALANLLPLPAFDGGQILIALIEWCTKKQIAPKTYYRLQLIGIGIVIVLFMLLLYVDVRHFLSIRR
jgi:regulator of sigma E protease